MKITVVHGQAHKKNTYKLTQMLLSALDCEKDDISEFYVNGISQCVGCTQCILKDEKLCPHLAETTPIIEAIDRADVILFDTPNYCMGMSGQLKSFCDHMAYRWMSHRPHDMRHKIGVAVSTAAGSGAKKATKEICNNFIWWSMGRTYQLPVIVSALNFDEISEKRMKKIKKKVARLADKINREVGKVKPCIKTRFFFRMMTMMHSGMAWSEVETAYWKKQGWIK